MFQRLLIATYLLLSVSLLMPVEAQSDKISTQNFIITQRRTIRPTPMLANVPLELSDINASVVIRGAHAETALEITVKNPGASGTEAEFLFPVPKQAVFKSFSYGEKAGQYPARLLSAEEARRLYDSIVAQAKDPALLEFAGMGTIRTSVFPVPARSSVKMKIVYEEVLSSSGGMYRYALPRTVTEQKTNWKIRVEVDGVQMGNVFCATHEIKKQTVKGNSCVVSLDDKSPVNPGTFRLSWVDGAVENSDLRVIACPDRVGREGYFMVLYGAGEKLLKESQKNKIKRELTFVLDRSGSMRGEKMEQVKSAVREIVKGLEAGELFNLISYNEGVDLFSEKPVVKSAETEKDALAWVDGLVARGGTNISEALETALSQPRTEGTLPLVLFLTDGLPTIGETSENKIVELGQEKNVGNRRIFSFGVGVDLNAPLLTRIAESAKGISTFILPNDDAEYEVTELFKKLNNPVLSDVKLQIMDKEGKSAPGYVRDVLPTQLPDLYEGSQLMVLGQYTEKGKKEGIKLLLTGMSAEGEVREELVFNAEEVASIQDDFVPRLWAMRKVGALQMELQKMGADLSNRRQLANDPKTKEIVESIINLSTEFGIMTGFTSFFADDGRNGLTRQGEVLARSVGSSFSGNIGFAGSASAIDVINLDSFELAVEAPRAGMAAVAKEKNIADNYQGKVVNRKNRFINGKGELVSAGDKVQQIAQNAYFKQDDIWVEDSLKRKEKDEVVFTPKHDRVVVIGTPEYSQVVDQLVKENRQAVLSLDGDVNIRLGEEYVLIKNRAE